MTLTDLLSIMAGLAGLIAGVGAFLKSRGETRKSDAEMRKSDEDAKHSAVDTANDALVIVRQVYEQRIAAMEQDIAALKAGRELDRKTIIELNQRLGNVMQAAETQSQQIQLWRERVEELLCILRENKIPLPDWANVKNKCDK